MSYEERIAIALERIADALELKKGIDEKTAALEVPVQEQRLTELRPDGIYTGVLHTGDDEHTETMKADTILGLVTRQVKQAICQALQ